MAVSKEQKYLYNERSKVYKSQAEDQKKEIATVKGAGRRSAKLDPYFQIKAGILGIQRANTLVQMSRLSQQIQNIKNDSLLNEARKELSSRMTDLLKIVGEDLDGTLTENLERLEGLSEMTPAQKLHLMTGFKKAVEKRPACDGRDFEVALVLSGYVSQAGDPVSQPAGLQAL